MNNSKKYLVIASGILIVILAGIYILQSLLSRGGTSTNLYPTPTLNPYGYTNKSTQKENQIFGRGSASSSTSLTYEQTKARSQMEQLKRTLPLETDDFTAEYSPNLNKIVVTRKNENADQAFSDMMTEKGYPFIVNNPDTTIVSDKSMEDVQTPYMTRTPQQDADLLSNIINVLIKPPVILTGKPTPTPAKSSSSSQRSSSSSSYTPKEYNGYVYYSQCHSIYASYPLAAGCTVCNAGCGPTTVAMILSSYVDKKYDPFEVVDIYKSIGAAACGTGMWYAKSVLNSHGVKTSDYIIPYTGTEHSIDDVRDDLRAYLDNGWTIFVLAWYEPGHGGGHYFWLTELDSKGNAMAFDPWYGMDQTPPINENIRYPMPKYAAAFGVKKQ